MVRIGFVCALSMFLPAFAFGQTVVGQGSADLKKTPTAMRLVLEVRGKGKDLKSALGSLEQRKKRAEDHLARLGAAKTTIRWEAAIVPVPALEGPPAFEPPLAVPFSNPQKPLPLPASPPHVADAEILVTSVLRVDFLLEGATADDRLVFVHGLQAKVRQIELSDDVNSGGAKACNCGCKGDPMFLFVATVSAAERSRTLAQAFQRARDAAHLGASAAGQELGTLQTLLDIKTTTGCATCPFAPQTLIEPDADGSVEIQGPGLTNLLLRGSISASFMLRRN